jgi:glutamyl/glutaminyl-tRNA synthetase
LGHARTFWVAQERAGIRNGTLILRNEDLDRGRCKSEFAAAMIEDLKWVGIQWQEGPDQEGAFGPYHQSERRTFYANALERLKELGMIYPCKCSRQDVMKALSAPHEGDEEPVYPGICRGSTAKEGDRISWRFRVPDGEAISFFDENFGKQQFLAGRDFGDFVVWRHDDVPAYQLAVTVDDAEMQITEVVRGADLLMSTARQLLIYRALNLKPPDFFHCELVTDESGIRLAKRHDSLSLRNMRAAGISPEQLRLRFNTSRVESKT